MSKTQKAWKTVLEMTCPHCGGSVVLPLTRKDILSLLKRRETIVINR